MLGSQLPVAHHSAHAAFSHSCTSVSVGMGGIYLYVMMIAIPVFLHPCLQPLLLSMIFGNTCIMGYMPVGIS